MFSAKIEKLAICFTALSLVSGCAILDKPDSDTQSNWLVKMFEKDGAKKASQATVFYSHGEFEKALSSSKEALKDNPRNQQALLVGALSSEKLERWNRARQYYEDLILIDGAETSILGSANGSQQKISQIAKSRLHNIALKQSDLLVANKDGVKKFKITSKVGNAQSKTTMNRAWKHKNIRSKTAPKTARIDNLFSQSEQNAISRFLVMKELAEKDLVTKQEFLAGRSANIGALLPLTHKAPALGVEQPVPAPDVILGRIEVLKEGVSTRAISPREYSAERNIIVEALLPPNPRARAKNKAPSRNIMGAAKDLRKLEVLFDLNLITSQEKAAEKKAIEKYLGINRKDNHTQVKTTEQTKAPVKATESVSLQPEKIEVRTTVEEVPIPIKPQIDTVTQGDNSIAIITKSEKIKTAPIVDTENVMSAEMTNGVSYRKVPQVSSPF